MLKSDIEEPDDLFALFKEAECHKAVIAIDEHSLCALKGVICYRKRYKHAEQMELGNVSEELESRIISNRQKRIVKRSESKEINKVSDNHIPAVF